MMYKAWSIIEEVLYCFSRSSNKFQSHTHRTENRRFWPKLSISGLQLQFKFTNGFEMMHKAWHGIEEVPYCFSMSSIKFQGYMGQNIDDLNPIWGRLLGRSQLSNPPDLPCFNIQEALCNMEYPSETHIKIKSWEVLFAHNIFHSW